MRQYTRPTLNAHSNKYFTTWTKSIKRKRSQVTKTKRAKHLWDNHLNTKARRNAVEQLREMNGNIMNCMYCEHDKAIVIKKDGVTKKRTEHAIVDHWQPKTKAPERTFDWANHFLACYRCNTSLKGNEFPLDSTGQALLIHPVDDNPLDNLEYNPSSGEFAPVTPKGDKTIEVFQLEEFSAMRKLVWAGLLESLREYDSALVQGDAVRADEVKNQWLKLEDFRSLLNYLVKIALGPSGNILTGPDIPDIVKRCDPLTKWR